MKKTLKDCPIHGHGANGLGCYCDLSKEKAKVLSIIAEEKAKWEKSAWCIDEGKRNPFGIGVHAGIEAIEHRVKEEL